MPPWEMWDEHTLKVIMFWESAAGAAPSLCRGTELFRHGDGRGTRSVELSPADDWVSEIWEDTKAMVAFKFLLQGPTKV